MLGPHFLLIYSLNLNKFIILVRINSHWWAFKIFSLTYPDHISFIFSLQMFSSRKLSTFKILSQIKEIWYDLIFVYIDGTSIHIYFQKTYSVRISERSYSGSHKLVSYFNINIRWPLSIARSSCLLINLFIFSSLSYSDSIQKWYDLFLIYKVVIVRCELIVIKVGALTQNFAQCKLIFADFWGCQEKI